MRCVFFLIFLVFSLGLAVPAYADTDYQCLRLCVNSGKTAAVCMPNCNYEPPRASAADDLVKPNIKTLSNHRVFSAPQDAGDTILLHKPLPRVQTPTKDYACMNICLQQNTTYALCERQCTPGLQGTNQDLKSSGISTFK